jgi:uncharacterized membrane protein YdbT with pleckstrin-like domain
MEILTTVLIVAVLMFIIFAPLYFFTRRSSDTRIDGDKLVIRYPSRKETISLKSEMVSWTLQQARMFWIGKVYSVNIQLKNGKWKMVSSRYNGETFQEIFEYLQQEYSNRRKGDI